MAILHPTAWMIPWLDLSKPSSLRQCRRPPATSANRSAVARAATRGSRSREGAAAPVASFLCLRVGLATWNSGRRSSRHGETVGKSGLSPWWSFRLWAFVVRYRGRYCGRYYRKRVSRTSTRRCYCGRLVNFSHGLHASVAHHAWALTWVDYLCGLTREVRRLGRPNAHDRCNCTSVTRMRRGV